MRPDLVLCSCNKTLAWDPESLQRELGLERPPPVYDRLARDEVYRLADRIGAGGSGRLLVACCGPPALFREVAGAAGVAPDALAVLNAKEACFWPHPDPPAANAKAARLLRALAETSPPPPQVPVKVGRTVLIATDTPAGLDLAARLADFADPILLLDERSSAFDGELRHPLPWRTTWGRLGRVDGTLGSFRVTVERTQPIDLDTCVYCRRCVPVCHTAAITEGLRLRLELCDRCGDCLEACAEVGAIKIPRQAAEVIGTDQVVVVSGNGAPARPRRTGHHVIRGPAAGAVDAAARKVLGLIGAFQRPQYVAYDPTTCAGGAAGHQACGRCITACPYEAVTRNARNPLRVQVDVQACEGCGACVSACPTSSLTFSDPPPGPLAGRLAALLAPLAGDGAAQPVIAFHCPERGAAALAEAGRARRPYPASVLPLAMACLRHVSEADVLDAIRLGAAGVALLGCATCPHGERELVGQRLASIRTILDAFGLGAERVALVAGDEPAAMIDALARFAASVPPAPIPAGAEAARLAGSRDRIAAAIAALIAASGREPGPVKVDAAAPFASPVVRAGGCTLCRTCVNVCPTHAFRHDENRQTLELKAIACVDCGLCATACPESVITLEDELLLERAALEYRVVVQDETLRCAKCQVPFGNKRALEIIEAKVAGMSALLDTFAGGRRNLLRLCPSCRAVAAMQEMARGWEP